MQDSIQQQNDLVAQSIEACASLWSVADWSENWKISEQQCHILRKHPAFPPDATVSIGARCVRFRVQRLSEFAARLAAERAHRPEPERLRRARQERVTKRDVAASWVADKTGAQK